MAITGGIPYFQTNPYHFPKIQTNHPATVPAGPLGPLERVEPKETRFVSVAWTILVAMEFPLAVDFIGIRRDFVGINIFYVNFSGFHRIFLDFIRCLIGLLWGFHLILSDFWGFAPQSPWVCMDFMVILGFLVVILWGHSGM